MIAGVKQVPKAKKQDLKRHNSLSDFDKPPGVLRARYLTICLRDEQWERIEWLAQHLNCEVERAATILLTQAAMEIDIAEMERHHGAVQMEEARSHLRKF